MMHILFNVTLVTSLHVNLVLGSFGLDPKAGANAAPEESRKLGVIGGNHQHSSLLHLHPDSCNDALQTGGILPPQAPSRMVPLDKSSFLEKPSISGDPISSGSSQERKRLFIEQPGIQSKGDEEIHKHASKKLVTDPNLSRVSHDIEHRNKSFLISSESKLDKEYPNETNSQKTSQEINSTVKHQDLNSLLHESSTVGVGRSMGSRPMNVESSIREFKPEGVNKDYWAWINIISEYVHVQEEINQYGIPLLNILKPSHFKNNQLYQNQNQEISSLSLKENSILSLASLLWCYNARVLEIIGASQGTDSYFKDQIQFMKWFDWFMLSFSVNLKFDLSTIYENKIRIEIKPEGRFIYKKVLQALDSNSDRKLYWLHQPKLSKVYHSNERQIILSEAAVHLLGFYYKNTNFKKWNYVFGHNDIDFVKKLKELGEHWEDREKWNLPPDLNLLPWADPCKQDLPLLGPNNLIKNNFNFHKYVEAIPCDESIFDLKDIEQNKKIYLLKHFSLSMQKKYGWFDISTLKLRKETKLLSEFKPRKNLIVSTQRIIAEYIDENSSQKETVKSERRDLLMKLNYVEIEAQLQNFLEFMWEINGKVLQSMGSEVFEEFFFKEQRMVQMFFEFLMDQDGGDNSRNEVPSQIKNSLKAQLKQIIQKSIIGLLVLKDNGVTHEISIEEYVSIKKIPVSRKHVYMSQLAVYLLGYYYKNENFESWNHIFVSDVLFVSFIENLSHPDICYKFEEKLFPQLRSQGLIPWKK